MADRAVRLPPELEGAPQRVLEEYVRARLVQFAGAFAARACPGLGPADVRAAAAAAIARLPPPERGRGAEARELQLVFRHDCLSLGCLDAQCALCEHNPRRRCSVNFAPKYLVNDVLRAKCEAAIRVEVIDRATGLPAPPDALAGCHLEVCVLDGNAYDARCLEAGAERGADLDACALLLNNKGAPLLATGPGGGHAADGRVVLHLAGGAAPLPDLHVTDSSEALLSGRKPPFRLLVRAVGPATGAAGGARGGAAPPARHAVSEGFVVATRRTRTAGKVEIPNVDDHVSKLEHMGKETVKKLQDVAGSAAAVGVDVRVPDNCVESVGQFRRLALLAEGDGHLRQKLQQVLKLSKEKWDDARDHALRAVVADSRARVWYADAAPGGPSPSAPGTQGLLFAARLGDIDLDRPLGLVAPGPGGGLEATLTAQLAPAQRDAVRALRPRAAAAWWQPGHPGWAIHPADSDAFLAAGGGGGRRGRRRRVGADVGAARGGGRGRRGRRGRHARHAPAAPAARPVAARSRPGGVHVCRGGHPGRRADDRRRRRGVPPVPLCGGRRHAAPAAARGGGGGAVAGGAAALARADGVGGAEPAAGGGGLPDASLLGHPARRHSPHALDGGRGGPHPARRHVGRPGRRRLGRRRGRRRRRRCRRQRPTPGRRVGRPAARRVGRAVGRGPGAAGGRRGQGGRGGGGRARRRDGPDARARPVARPDEHAVHRGGPGVGAARRAGPGGERVGGGAAAGGATVRERVAWFSSSSARGFR